jgi:EAL domain-containing protein (putative c-di-GMP-specific phosphodiesterase class I)
VAEGIETPAQLRALRDMGCELGQGFLFARSLSAGDFEAYAIGVAHERRAS